MQCSRSPRPTLGYKRLGARVTAVLLTFVLSFSLFIPTKAMASPCSAYKGFSGGYCTPYAARQFDRAAPSPGVNWRGDAGQWYDSAHRAGWQVTKNPKYAKPGSVIVWTRQGRAGHVGVVRKVTSKYVYIDEANWKGRYTTSSARLPIDNLDRTNYRFKGFVIPERKMKPQVKAPILSTVMRGRATTLTATVVPGYLKKGSTDSRMVLERYQGGKWNRQATKKALVTTSSSRTDKIQVRASMPKTGRWRMRAEVPGNSKYRSQKTAWSYFRVR